MFLATPIIRHVTRPDASLQRFMQAATSAAQQLNGDFQVSQTDEATVLSIDVPGLSREQLQLRIEDHMVHLHSVEGAPRQLDLGVLTLTLQRRKPVDKTVTLNIQ